MVKDLQVVGFRVGGGTFGVPIVAVHEIMRLPEITAVPEAPECVEGVTNLRGKIIPVLDLRKRFGKSAVHTHKRNRVLVAELAGKFVGLIVDEASEVLKIPFADIEDTPDLLEERQVDYVTGVGKLAGRLILLVDLTKVLQAGELKQIGIM